MAAAPAIQVRVIDSHTAGEPTRVVIAGGPELGGGSAADQLRIFQEEHDDFRAAVINEPRGSEPMVGALLLKPADKSCAAGVLFFNNVGVLGMCGHGAIGVIATLAHLEIVSSGEHLLETPAGVVRASLGEDGRIALTNVASYRIAKDVRVDVPGFGTISGDVAWGGNWFFLLEEPEHELVLEQRAELTARASAIRRAVNANGFPMVDHVALFGPPSGAEAQSRNFVLCPGNSYDRSPCGTGTSAKLACLAADGALVEGAEWVQESIIGSVFRATFRWEDRAAGRIVPTINGSAFITAEATLLFDENDPFCWGIR